MVLLGPAIGDLVGREHSLQEARVSPREVAHARNLDEIHADLHQSFSTLFDGHALGQVAGLVHVAAAQVGDVVREHLERNDVDDRGEKLRRRRQAQDVFDVLEVAEALGPSTMIWAPRAFTSSRLDIVLSNTWDLVAMTRTGISVSISAIGPCFSSPRHSPRRGCRRSPELQRGLERDRKFT